MSYEIHHLPDIPDTAKYCKLQCQKLGIAYLFSLWGWQIKLCKKSQTPNIDSMLIFSSVKYY